MPILDWLNKKQAVKTASKVPYKVLVENKELSYGDQTLGNMLIKGDNLEALKALLPYYKGKVKCIYIDPPYNTGSAFEHYDDNLEHSTWLSMMYPRLELLRELLAENGSIWVSLDDTEQAYLKVIMDEVFGRNNFIQTISNQSTPNGRDYGFFAQTHDFIHIYAKNCKLLQMNKIENDDIEKYNKRDSHGKYYLHPLFNSNSNFHKGNRPNLYYPFYVSTKPNSEGYYDLSVDKKIGYVELYPPISKTDGTQFVWRWGKDKSIQNLNKEIVGQLMKNGKFRIAQKMRIQEKIPRTIWIETSFSTRRGTEESQALFGKAKFSYPKPEPLIERIISIGSNEGDLVLDSFLGSGTTAAVAQKMGRKYIGIEMGEHAITHCVPRLKQVIDGTDQGGISKNVNWQGGGGYTFYDLGPAIFDDKDNINQNIKFKDLAFHIWFSETKQPLQKYKYSPLIGICKDIAYYLLYNGVLGDKSVNGGNVLTSKILESLPKHNGPKVIYGEACRLSKERLLKEQIIFKQTPYDVKSR